MIPLKYTFRNLRVRWVTTLMTVAATGVVVFISALTFGFTDGLDHALRISGDPLDVIVLRKGSTDETGSGLSQDLARQVATLDGIATDEQGNALCSIEYATILTKPRRDGGTTNLIVRGVDQVGRTLRPGFRVVQGRDVESGLNQVITSEKMSQRFANLALGEKLEINQTEFEVVGYFEAGGSAAESEVWTALADLTAARRQQGAVSSVNLRAESESAKEDLIRALEEDDQFNLKAIGETEYFQEQMTSAIAMKVVGSVMAVFLTMGAMFAAANTMYAAVANRAREIGTLRALGFRRRSILTSFMFEALGLVRGGRLAGLFGHFATERADDGNSELEHIQRVDVCLSVRTERPAAGDADGAGNGIARRLVSGFAGDPHADHQCTPARLESVESGEPVAVRRPSGTRGRFLQSFPSSVPLQVLKEELVSGRIVQCLSDAGEEIEN